MLVQYEGRFRHLIYFILILFTLVFTRTTYVSFKYSYLNETDFSSFQSPSRGEIFDRNGKILASNYELFSVYIDPSEINDVDTYAKIFAEELNLDEESTRENIIKRKDSRFLWIKRFLSNDEYLKLQKRNLKSVFFKTEYKRSYPLGQIIAPVLGFTNIYQKGMEGFEYEMDNILYNSKTNIELTIDSYIQYLLYDELYKRFIAEKPKWAGGIVQNAMTGEILALVKLPTYNPHEYMLYDQSQIKNNLITDIYEPGSIFKPFIFAALENSSLLPKNFKTTCSGSYSVTENIKIQDKIAHGTVDVNAIIKHSCNVGTIKASEYIDKNLLFEYLQSFNFGSKTAVKLPGETAGILKKPAQWTKMTKAIINIGQEIGVNAVQVISAFSSLINGGKYFQPLIIKTIRYSGSKTEDSEPVVIHEPITTETSDYIRNLLVHGIESGSTGESAFISGLKMGGKTGTAQIPSPKGGYYEDKNLTSFIGYFENDGQLYSVYILFYDPKENVYGGSSAAPVFRNFVLRFLDYLSLQHSKKYDVTINALDYDYSVVLQRITDPAVLPDFKGLTVKEAVFLASKLNIKITLKGNGFVSDQNYPPGTPLKNIETLKLVFSQF